MWPSVCTSLSIAFVAHFFRNPHGIESFSQCFPGRPQAFEIHMSDLLVLPSEKYDFYYSASLSDSVSNVLSQHIKYKHTSLKTHFHSFTYYVCTA